MSRISEQNALFRIETVNEIQADARTLTDWLDGNEFAEFQIIHKR